MAPKSKQELDSLKRAKALLARSRAKVAKHDAAVKAVEERREAERRKQKADAEAKEKKEAEEPARNEVNRWIASYRGRHHGALPSPEEMRMWAEELRRQAGF